MFICFPHLSLSLRRLHEIQLMRNKLMFVHEEPKTSFQSLSCTWSSQRSCFIFKTEASTQHKLNRSSRNEHDLEWSHILEVQNYHMSKSAETWTEIQSAKGKLCNTTFYILLNQVYKCIIGASVILRHGSTFLHMCFTQFSPTPFITLEGRATDLQSWFNICNKTPII